MVYLIGGRKNTAIAVQAGGRGDVTSSHVKWRVREGSNVSSAVYYEGHIYWTHDRGTALHCLNAETGEQVYAEELDPEPGLVYSSLTVADGKLYSVAQNNATYVFAASPQFQQLKVNTFEGDDSRANASAVILRNRILLRSDKAIYCVGAK